MPKLNVATNSMDVPGPKLLLEKICVPFTVTAPPLTVVEPGLNTPVPQSDGTVVPENSSISAGLRITAPPPSRAVKVLAS